MTALDSPPTALPFVQVAVRPGLPDPVAHAAHQALSASLAAAGLPAGVLRGVRFVQGYVLEGLDAAGAARAGVEVLADPVTQDCALDGLPFDVGDAARVVSVLRKPGVTDPVEASCRTALAALGLDATSVRTVRRFVLELDPRADVSDAVLHAAAGDALANEVIEEIHTTRELALSVPHPAPYRMQVRHVPLAGLDDHALLALSRERTLSLTAAEMRAIQAFFADAGRDPTDAELDTLAQTWSEHCKHKTLAGAVDFEGEGGPRSYENLLKETVFEATQRLDREDCLSVFVDNAGVIAFDDEHGVCMKVETHNHPSAIEPYGGAGTGIGGVIRDILGTGNGAKPFLNTDVFCFAPPDTPADEVPPGCLHPRRTMHGVVSGVRDYGNRMGIPTASGGLFFDPRYVGNPLVYCGTVGLIPRKHIAKAAQPGDVIVAVGGRTGRDGIHGATFSSVELHEESETVSAGAVQIGNPIEEKRVLDALLRVRDEGLLNAVTDCGAGGFSSAVGEMAEEIGAEVALDRAPLKYAGLTYAEIWISEAQERMVLAVPPDNVARVRALFEAEGVEVTELGHFRDDRRLVLTYNGETVCDLPLAFVHDGLPRVRRKAAWTRPEATPFPWAELADVEDWGDDLRAILGSWNVCSKEWVIRQYDHEVQGGSAVKPLVGVRGDGPGDAAVATPVPGSPRGVAVACGMNPRLGDGSPYDMAAQAVDEALRNLCAVGADPRAAALLDNFSWGNTSKPDRLGSIVLASEGLRDAALAFGTPFVSGKDSLNNEYQVGGRTIAIPPTLLVSAFAVVPDVRQCVTMDAKAAGNHVYVVGTTDAAMGGSHLGLVRGLGGGAVPTVDFAASGDVFDAVHRAIKAGTVRSCHDASEGGLAVTLAEMAFAGGLGIDADLGAIPTRDGPPPDGARLFAETPGRLVCEVAPDREAAFLAALDGVPAARIGTVTSDDRLVVRIAGQVRVDEPLEDLRKAFTAPLANGAAPGGAR